MADRTCERCPKPVHCKGLCSAHYQQQRYVPKRAPGTCLKGHPLTPDNVTIVSNGARRCSICLAAYQRPDKGTCPGTPGKPCGLPVHCKGVCRKHYVRIYRHGDAAVVLQIVGDDEARFWSKVDRRGDDECWPWLGGLNIGGYAEFAVGDKMERAHRWAYQRFVGPIPDGCELDHVKANGCVRRDCTNFISHLEAVTHSENLRRSDRRKTHCKQGHEFTPENTYRSTLADGSTRRACRICVRESQRRYQERKAGNGDCVGAGGERGGLHVR